LATRSCNSFRAPSRFPSACENLAQKQLGRAPLFAPLKLIARSCVLFALLNSSGSVRTRQQRSGARAKKKNPGEAALPSFCAAGSFSLSFTSTSPSAKARDRSMRGIERDGPLKTAVSPSGSYSGSLPEGRPGTERQDCWARCEGALSKCLRASPTLLLRIASADLSISPSNLE